MRFRPPPKSAKAQINFKLNRQDFEKFRSAAWRQKKTYSAAAREAVLEWMRKAA